MICAQRTAYPLPRHGRKKLTLPFSEFFIFFVTLRVTQRLNRHGKYYAAAA